MIVHRKPVQIHTNHDNDLYESQCYEQIVTIIT